MDSFGIYKDKLNEALTLVPSMSQPKKMEAVSYWNNAATYFQTIINPIVSDRQAGQEHVIVENLEAHDSPNLDGSRSSQVSDIVRDTCGSVVSDALGSRLGTHGLPVDRLDRQFCDAFLNARNDPVVEASHQSVILENINPYSSGLLAAVATPHHGCFKDPIELGGDISLASLDTVDYDDQQAVIDSIDGNDMLNPTLRLSNPLEIRTDLTQQVYYTRNGHSNSISQINTDNSVMAYNFNEHSPMNNLHPDYRHKSQNNAALEDSADVPININDKQFNLEPEAPDLSKKNQTLNHIEPASLYSGGSSHGTRPLQQIQICPETSDNTTLFDEEPVVDEHTGQSIELNSRQPHFDTFASATQLAPILSPGTMNCTGVCPQQTTETLPNIDTAPHSKIDKILHTCEVCGKSGFSTKGNLKRHQKAHTGEKPFECDHCNARFTEKKSLKIHLRKHTGEKPYKCEICDQLFAQTAVLKSHMMSLHLDERKFVCHKCDKAFKQSSQLKLHLMRHEGIKKLGCTKCQARFLTKGDLERHFRVHTGERPYRCDLCGRAFTRQQSLNEHMNRHYDRKPFKCKHCDREFSEMSACYKHTKQHSQEANRVNPS